MTDQQTDRDHLRENAAEGGAWGAVVLALLGQLGQLDKAEARIKAVEDVLDAEEARPRPIGGGYDKRAMVRIADIRRALES